MKFVLIVIVGLSMLKAQGGLFERLTGQANGPVGDEIILREASYITEHFGIALGEALPDDFIALLGGDAQVLSYDTDSTEYRNLKNLGGIVSVTCKKMSNGQRMVSYVSSALVRNSDLSSSVSRDSLGALVDDALKPFEEMSNRKSDSIFTRSDEAGKSLSLFTKKGVPIGHLGIEIKSKRKSTWTSCDCIEYEFTANSTVLHLLLNNHTNETHSTFYNQLNNRLKMKKESDIKSERKEKQLAESGVTEDTIVLPHKQFQQVENLIGERFGLKIGSRITSSKEELNKNRKGHGAYYIKGLKGSWGRTPGGVKTTYRSVYGYITSSDIRSDTHYLRAITAECYAPIAELMPEFNEAAGKEFVKEMVDSDDQPIPDGFSEKAVTRQIPQYSMDLRDASNPKEKLEIAFCDDKTRTFVVTTENVFPFLDDDDKLEELDGRMQFKLQEAHRKLSAAAKRRATKILAAKQAIEREERAMVSEKETLAEFEKSVEELLAAISTNKKEIAHAQAAMLEEKYVAKLNAYRKIKGFLEIGEAFYQWYDTRMDETELQRDIHYQKFKGKRMAFGGIVRDVRQGISGRWYASLFAKARYLGLWNFNTKFYLDDDMLGDAAKWDKTQFLILIGTECGKGGFLHEITLDNTSVASEEEHNAVSYFSKHPESELPTKISIAQEKIKLSSQKLMSARKKVEDQKAIVDSCPEKIARAKKNKELTEIEARLEYDDAKAKFDAEEARVKNETLQFLSVDEKWLHEIRP